MHSFYDDHPAQHVVPSNTVLVGFCTGLLAAVAVSASQSTLDLVDNALNIVRVAFRIGVKVNDAAQRLSTEVNQRWPRLVLGAQKEASIAEVRHFNESKVRIASASFSLFYAVQRHSRLEKTAQEDPPQRAGARQRLLFQRREVAPLIVILRIELKIILGFTAG